MALSLSSSPAGLVCERDCREIHAKLDRLSLLGHAVARRTPAERRQIRDTYRAIYGEDLVEHLGKAQEANPTLESCNMLYLWMLDSHDRDAVVARDAVAGIGEADYKALVEIYAGRKSNQLFHINRAYLARFRSHLDQDIISQPSHPYQKILVALATSHRAHHVEISQHIAKCDAKRLFDAAKGFNGEVDESVILELFSKRSIAQLRMSFCSYRHIYGHSYTKALKKESRGEFSEPLRIVVKCMHDPAKYYSKMLHTSMKGSTSNKSVLSRLMLHSVESGMEEIKGAFLKKYEMKLKDAICRSVPVGDYREFLVALTDAYSSPS